MAADPIQEVTLEVVATHMRRVNMDPDEKEPRRAGLLSISDQRRSNLRAELREMRKEHRAERAEMLEEVSDDKDHPRFTKLVEYHQALEESLQDKIKKT